MTLALPDTNVILGLVRGELAVPSDFDYVLSEYVIREIETGAHRAISDEPNFLGRLGEVAITLEAFDTYRSFDGSAYQTLLAEIGPVREIKAGFADTLIAAHAKALGAIVLTNDKGFRAFARSVPIFMDYASHGRNWQAVCGRAVNAGGILCGRPDGHSGGHDGAARPVDALFHVTQHRPLPPPPSAFRSVRAMGPVSRCQAVLVSGPRRGQSCGNPLPCGVHSQS